MSYANGTTHYNLPQTVGTDKRDWFDTNSAFADLDAALYAAATGQAADAEAIATINSKLATDESNIAALQTASSSQSASISSLQTTVNQQANAIADVRQDAEDMISAYNEGAAETSTHAYAIGDYFIYNDVLYKATAAIAVGDTIVPNTNCQATNVTTEIKAVEASIPADKVGNLADLTTTDKSSAVAAINEVKSDLTNVNDKISWKERTDVNLVSDAGGTNFTATFDLSQYRLICVNVYRTDYGFYNAIVPCIAGYTCTVYVSDTIFYTVQVANDLSNYVIHSANPSLSVTNYHPVVM